MQIMKNMNVFLFQKTCFFKSCLDSHLSGAANDVFKPILLRNLDIKPRIRQIADISQSLFIQLHTQRTLHFVEFIFRSVCGSKLQIVCDSHEESKNVLENIGSKFRNFLIKLMIFPVQTFTLGYRKWLLPVITIPRKDIYGTLTTTFSQLNANQHLFRKFANLFSKLCRCNLE